MKKVISYVLCLFMLVLMCACSSNSDTENSKQTTASEPSTEAAAKDTTSGAAKTIHIFQYKVDTVEQMQNLSDMFCEQYGKNIKLEVETVGSEYATTLKTKFASSDIPDMFCTSTYGDLEQYEEYIVDLSDQPWIDKCVEGTLSDVSKGGKTYGQPLVIESYGFIYNKELFKKAGIEAAPTTFSQLVEACKKLSAAGITPFVNGYKENWVIGQHFFNGALLNKVDMDGVEFATKVGVTETYASQEASREMARLLQLTIEYGLPNSIAEDYNTSLADFAAGKAAIISQGTWIQPTIDELNPDMDLGIFGYLTNDDEDADVLPVGVSGFWVIYNKSEYINELKDFLTYMGTNEAAINSLVKDFKFMPPFSGVEYNLEQLGDISVGVGEYAKAGKTSGWFWTRLPEGFHNEYCPIMQAFCAGNITADEMISQLDKVAAASR